MAYESKNWFDKLPPEDKEIDKVNFKLFYDLMIERQNIWYKRFILKKKSPWTKNKILRDYKFTNVYRELDKNSQWLIQNIILKETDRKEIIWQILLFRIFNNPDLFIWISFQDKSFKGYFPSYYYYDNKELAKLIMEYEKLGKKPFTSAYFINPNCVGMSRTEHYSKNVLKDLHNSVSELDVLMTMSDDPKDLIDRLKQNRAVADFIAHEFYQDFTYPEIYTDNPLMNFNQDDYTNVGDGAKLGIRLIFPSIKSKKASEDAIELLRDYGNDYLDSHGFKFLRWDRSNNKYNVEKYGKISLHQIEMWLCEFGKYWKMINNVGKQRGKFTPKTIISTK